ncbi:MAG: hypothetical protein AAB260_02405, partial [Planctomycetota bacterium]
LPLPPYFKVRGEYSGSNFLIYQKTTTISTDFYAIVVFAIKMGNPPQADYLCLYTIHPCQENPLIFGKGWGIFFGRVSIGKGGGPNGIHLNR